MKLDIRKQLRDKFRSVESAYSSFDFPGAGNLTMRQLMKQREMKVILQKYSAEDVKSWFYRDNIFKK